MANGAVVRGFASVAFAGLAVFALSACELAVHQVEKSQRDCSRAWQAGCPVAVDISVDRPIQSSRMDRDRDTILKDAETAPYRRCDVLPAGCQVLGIGGVLADSYATAL